MTEGLPSGSDMPTQPPYLTDILHRLAGASGGETAHASHEDAFRINAEAYPHVAEAAERISEELEILDGQQRMIEATAVASSILWPKTHDGQDVHLLDSRLEQYRSAVDHEIYEKDYHEIQDALRESRRGYLRTFWTHTSDGLIVPSLEGAQMPFMINVIEGTLDDPSRFHSTMTTSVLPLFAAMTKRQTPQMAETYLALRRAVEANAVGWLLDPYTTKNHTPAEVKQLIGWDNTEVDLLAAVDPFDGYEEEPLRSYPYVSFMPRIVGGSHGGRAVTELGTRNPISRA